MIFCTSPLLQRNSGEIRGKMEKDQQYMVIKRIRTSCFLKGMIFFVRGVRLGALKGKKTNSASLFFIIK